MSTTSHTAPLPPELRDHLSALSNRRPRIRGTGAEVNDAESRQVVRIVPNKANLLQAQPVPFRERGQRPGFVFAVLVNVTDAKLAG